MLTLYIKGLRVSLAYALPLMASLSLLLPPEPSAAARPMPIPAPDLAVFHYESSQGLAFGSSGVWFAGPNQIDRIDSSGVLTGVFYVPPSVGHPYPAPTQVRAGGGAIWFNDYDRTQEGEFVGTITNAGLAREFPVNLWTFSLAVGNDGKAWYAGEQRTPPGEQVLLRFDISGHSERIPVPNLELSNLTPGLGETVWASHGSTVFHIWADGEKQETQVPGGAIPVSFTPDGSGGVWFTLPHDAIVHITSDGVQSELKVPSPTGTMSGIAVGSDGNIWVGEGGGLIARVTPLGVVTTFSHAAPSRTLIWELFSGPEGDLWYASGYEQIVRLAIPVAPSVATSPEISGEPLFGFSMSVSTGTWAHNASQFAYQWQNCEATGDGCVDIPAATSATLSVPAAAVGKRLQVIVTASGIGGSSVAATSLSAIIQPPPKETQNVLSFDLVPTVHALVTWRFSSLKGRTRARVLNVEGLSVGAAVELRCQGKGCPFSHLPIRSGLSLGKRCSIHKACTGKSGELELASLLGGHRLGAKAILNVTVTKPGWIGKSFRFVARSKGSPEYSSQCLRPGSTELIEKC